ncbi:hypothetical protein [Salinactinospora qingdaonensis]|uniref:HicA toxin of toxin-antitoxin n=1 Tax=Salinactinospora qingdaonensis TaxID=702744 RepID=A0ABP7FRF3_9ACTN
MTGKEISPADHPDKEIRRVLNDLAAKGWVVRKEGHWGRLYCDCGCSCIQIPGSAKNVTRAARRIAREAQRCPLPPTDPRRSLTGSHG